MTNAFQGPPSSLRRHAGWVPLIVAACSPPAATTQPPVAEVPAVADTAPSPPARLERPPTKLPPIAERRVGDLVVDEPLPARVLGGDLAASYRTSLYSDAQPLEGFALVNPPVFAAVEGGPYHDFGMASPGAPIPDDMPSEAAQLAKDGKLTLKMIIVTDPRLRTAEGQGVGSTFTEVKQAYPDLDASRYPGLWEEPSCIVRPREKSSIHFFFKGCERREAADTFVDSAQEVIRVVVLPPWD